MKFLRSFLVAAGMFGTAAAAHAQVPVTDAAVLSQTQQTASNTNSIMNSSQQILQTVNKTLSAVTGNRQTGNLAQAALGNGFSMGGAPDMSSLLSSGQMSWGNLGSLANVATQVLNGLKLVKTISGNTNMANLSGPDRAYQGAVNTAAALTSMVQGTQQSAMTRTQAFTAASGQIGTAQDIKGSIDQNSQLQIQNGQTVNELIGVMNANNAALNAQQQVELAAQAKAASVMSYDPSKATFVGTGQ